MKLYRTHILCILSVTAIFAMQGNSKTPQERIAKAQEILENAKNFYIKKAEESFNAVDRLKAKRSKIKKSLAEKQSSYQDSDQNSDMKLTLSVSIAQDEEHLKKLDSQIKKKHKKAVESNQAYHHVNFIAPQRLITFGNPIEESVCNFHLMDIYFDNPQTLNSTLRHLHTRCLQGSKLPTDRAQIVCNTCKEVYRIDILRKILKIPKANHENAEIPTK
ncbi:MAG TPA: hypothetical protein VEK38_00770 [Candidatus Bathyarchaeia archaeon]|nr:hypothetical protein [Candidatus Bathyarchaeia archaeon]